LVQRYRNRAAAKHLIRKLLKRKVSVLRIMIIDKLRSYAAAKREIMPGIEPRSQKGLNNWSEDSY